MSNILLTQKEIAERSGLSQQYISMILKGDRQPTIATAKKLEKATSICKEAWLFPTDHWNPYEPFTDTGICGHCDRKDKRTRYITEEVVPKTVGAHGERGMVDLIKAIRLMHNWPDSMHFTFFWLYEDRNVRIAHSGGHPFLEYREAWNHATFPWWFGLLRERGEFHVHYVPEFHFPKGAESERKYINAYGARSIYGFHDKVTDLTHVIASFHEYVIYSPEQIKEIQKGLHQVGKILQQSD